MLKLQLSWKGPYKMVTCISDIVQNHFRVVRRMIMVHLGILVPYLWTSRDKQP
jgi:hypothetical protein